MTSPQALKRTASSLLEALAGGASADQIFADGAIWHGPHPLNDRTGPAEIGAVWSDLRAAMPDLERRPAMMLAGENLPDARVSTARHAHLVATLGHYMGTFRAPWLGIPPTHGAVTLPFAEVHALDGDRIIESWCLWDLLDLMRQARVWPLPPMLGAPGLWPMPQSGDGVRTHYPDELEAGKTSMDQVLAMHAALGAFDGQSLESMPHAQYWTRDFMWYGAAGIGATRGLEGFRAHHQIPFLHAFPDRKGAGHYIRIGDGPFAVTGGWPSVTATHQGTWLGMTATGQPIEMRVMDFYRLQDGLIAENWVPMDVIHIALQMGNDIFARLAHMQGNPALAL